MDPARRFLIKMTEETLRVDFHSGNVTVIEHPHSTGWRTLPGLVTAQVLDASVVILVAGKEEHFVHSGDAVCIAPHLHHRIDMTTHPPGISRWSLASFFILGSINVFSLFELPLSLTGESGRRTGDINAELAQLYQLTDPTFQQALKRRSLASLLAAVVIENSKLGEVSMERLQKLERLVPVLKHIEEQLASPLDTGQLGKLVHLSPSRFHTLFRSVFGTAPGHYRQALRMQKAQQLLISTDLTVDEVGRRVGHVDPFHFSRIFKKLSGASPSIYRKRMLKGLS